MYILALRIVPSVFLARVITPFVDAATGNLSIAFCSGHGECGAEYRTCECQLGYGGAGCQISFETFTVVLCALIAVFCASLIWSARSSFASDRC